MSHSPWARRLSIALLTGIVACIAAATVLLATIPEPSAGEGLGLLIPAMSFAVVGAVVVLRRPENRMGWIFVAIGWFLASGTLADEIGNRWVPGEAGPPSLVVLATWYSEWFWLPFIFLSLSLGVLLFPTGRAPGPGWRRFALAVATIMVFLTIAAALDPAIETSQGRKIDNPIGVSPIGDPDDEPLNAVFALTVLVSLGGGLIGHVQRFRSSRGEERQQLKWFTFSAGVQVAGFILGGVFELFEDAWWIEGLVLSALPVGAGIAILRYRLYDIDVVINRTLVYAALTAVLVAAYGGGVLLFRTVLAPVTGESDLAVAASTLGVAALFGPARRRIQGFIDRRFYRSRYDAHQTLEAFATRLRDEVDLDALSGELFRVVTQTVQPRHASVSLFQGATR